MRIARPEPDVSAAAAPSGPTAAPTFAAGATLSNRFRIVQLLAGGGMGEVYEADDLELGERVALKTVRPEIAADDRTLQRFRREITLARRATTDPEIAAS